MWRDPREASPLTVEVNPLQHAVVVLTRHKPLVDWEIVVDLETGIESITIDVHIRDPHLAGNAPASDKQDQAACMLMLLLRVLGGCLEADHSAVGSKAASIRSMGRA